MGHEPYCVWCNQIGHAPSPSCRDKSAAPTTPSGGGGEHTPTPWVQFTDQGKCYALMPAGRPGDVCTFQQAPSDADAAFIVDCVNSHATLKARIEELETALTAQKISLGQLRNAFKDEAALDYPVAGVRLTRMQKRISKAKLVVSMVDRIEATLASKGGAK